MNSINEFTERVLSDFSKKITDQVFLMIQNDKKLMHEYLKLVEKNGLTTVNQQIGRKVKTRFGLENDLTRNEMPKSTLIQSHQEFE